VVINYLDPRLSEVERRDKQYWDAAKFGDWAAEYEFLQPSDQALISKEDFIQKHSSNRSIVRVDGVDIENVRLDGEDHAVVRVTVKANTGQWPVTDNWTNVNGQWYRVLREENKRFLGLAPPVVSTSPKTYADTALSESSFAELPTDASVAGSAVEPVGASNELAELYCLKCRAKRHVIDVENVAMKNGKPAVRGKCFICGTTMYGIGSSAAPALRVGRTERPAGPVPAAKSHNPDRSPAAGPALKAASTSVARGNSKRQNVSFGGLGFVVLIAIVLTIAITVMHSPDGRVAQVVATATSVQGSESSAQATATLRAVASTSTATPTLVAASVSAPTPSPLVDEHALTVANVTKSLQDNDSFLAPRSFDAPRVQIGEGDIDGEVYITITPSLLNETDALTKGSVAALKATKALFDWYPGLTVIDVGVVADVTNQYGNQYKDQVASITISNLTARKFDYSGLADRVLADNKLLFCVADGYSITNVVWTKIKDRGCLSSSYRLTPCPVPRVGLICPG